jgi:hypothetical protein
MLDLGRLDPWELPAGGNVPCLIRQAGDGKERRLESCSEGQPLEIAGVDGLGDRGELEVAGRDVPGNVAGWSA